MYTLRFLLHSLHDRRTVVLPRNRGVTVAQVGIATMSRCPCREGSYETTEANRNREMEPEQYWFRGGSGTSASQEPHGAPRPSIGVPYWPLAPFGTPGPILPSVGWGVHSRTRRPSSPARPRHLGRRAGPLSAASPDVFVAGRGRLGTVTIERIFDELRPTGAKVSGRFSSQDLPRGLVLYGSARPPNTHLSRGTPPPPEPPRSAPPEARL